MAFPLRVHTDLPEDMIRDIVLLKLQAVGLRGARKLMPDELSGGMKRRVALARAIALDPALMMYDEPFVGQDPISMGVLVRLIRLLNDAMGLTSIVVSHDLAETASIAQSSGPEPEAEDTMWAELRAIPGACGLGARVSHLLCKFLAKTKSS